MKPFLLALLLFLSFFAKAQEYFPSRINLAVNLPPLIAGTPEFQGEYFMNRFVGVTAAGGATFRPVRGGIKVDDGVDVKSSRGVYWKIGLKGRWLISKKSSKKKLSVWLQMLYIGSQYDEESTRGISTNPSVDPNKTVSVSGVVHGFAASPGVDIYLNKRLDLRLGYQVGYFERNYSLGGSSLYSQPGFGSTWFVLPEQFILGLNYRMGQINKKTEKE